MQNWNGFVGWPSCHFSQNCSLRDKKATYYILIPVQFVTLLGCSDFHTRLCTSLSFLSLWKIADYSQFCYKPTQSPLTGPWKRKIYSTYEPTYLQPSPVHSSDVIPSFPYRIFMIAVALIMTYFIDSFAMSLRVVWIQTRKLNVFCEQIIK